jgi:hypothetical protein
MLDTLDQGVEVSARICAEAKHEVVERPEGHRASVGDAATIEPNAEAGRLQLVGERLVLSSMQAIFERGGFETYERGLMLLKRRFAPNPRGPQLGRFDAAVLAQTPFRALRAVRPTHPPVAVPSELPATPGWTHSFEGSVARKRKLRATCASITTRRPFALNQEDVR